MVAAYNKNCKIKTIITPGTPKNPTIKAESQLISNTSPKFDPIRFNKNNTTPPIKAFSINLIIILKGNAKIFNTTNKIKTAIKKLTYPMLQHPFFSFFRKF